ncbi:MAG: 2-phosphosulfolactate phosphatase [Candidatus Hydrogenedentes bacterium]|nr:2-phosphosulfolactate phosphatase [Candidatus Hydrogenedentota bacterium]
MRVHVIEGAGGCAFAAGRRAVAVVVDALRASATAAALLHAGAVDILAVPGVGGALAARRERPDALLYGERGGLPPEGFDHGNSPAEAHHAAGRRVVFTTTTGAGRLSQCAGAGAVLMGTVVNASAAVAAARRLAGPDGEVVFIPAGLMDDPAFDAQEDRAAAVFLLECLRRECPDAEIGEGRDLRAAYAARLAEEGILRLFETAPHAEKLRRIHLESDIPLCADPDRYPAVPLAAALSPEGVLLRRA